MKLIKRPYFGHLYTLIYHVFIWKEITYPEFFLKILFISGRNLDYLSLTWP